MHTEIVTNLSRFEQLSLDWRALVADMECSEIYDTWEWISCCLREYHGPEAEPFIVAVFDGDRCVALAPLLRVCERFGGVSVRSLQWISYKLAMYSNFCLSKHYNQSVLLKYISEALHARQADWDIMKLENVNSNNKSTFLARKVLMDSFKTYSTEAEVVPYLDYAESYPHRINKKEIKGIERRQRKLMREHEVRIVLDQPFDTAIWERVLQLNLAKWEDSYLHDDRYRLFSLRLHTMLSGQGRLGMSYIEIDGQIEAVNICHYMGTKVYGKIMNYSPQFAQYGLGLILMNNILEYFHGKEMRECDFEGGTQPYKFYWTDSVRQNFNYYVCSNGRKKAWVCVYIWLALFLRQSGTVLHWRLTWRKHLTRWKIWSRRQRAESRRGENAY